jgi:hypothetical protein
VPKRIEHTAEFWLRIAFPAFVLAACAPSLQPKVRGMGQAWSPVRVALFLPVATPTSGSDGEILDDAPQVLREELAVRLQAGGCVLASPVDLDTLVSQNVGNPDLTFGQAAELAARVGADIALVGRVHAYRRGFLFGPSTRVDVRFDVVATDGQGMGTLRYAETAAQEDPAILARDVATKIAHAIDSAWGGCPVGN